MTGTADIRTELARLASVPDGEIDLAEAALALAALHRPDRDRDWYRGYLRELAAEVLDRLGGRADAPLADRLAALASVLAARHRFVGEAEDDDDADDDFMRVIDRRRGLPVALGILYLDVGRRLGWAMDGLGFPSHFLVRLDSEDGGRAILDPFHGGARLDAAGLRGLLKAVTGIGAELKPAHYAPVGNREVLLRLQDGVKLRRLRCARLKEALETVEDMLLFAPQRASLWREAGMMHLRLGDLPGAMAALEQYVARAPETMARYRISVLLQELRGRPQ